MTANEVVDLLHFGAILCVLVGVDRFGFWREIQDEHVVKLRMNELWLTSL